MFLSTRSMTTTDGSDCDAEPEFDCANDASGHNANGGLGMFRGLGCPAKGFSQTVLAGAMRRREFFERPAQSQLGAAQAAAATSGSE
jgi:hypothetical protein